MVIYGVRSCHCDKVVWAFIPGWQRLFIERKAHLKVMLTVT